MNLIFCAYAHLSNFKSGHNLKESNNMEIYLKNAFVALKSARMNNPDDAVALVTNSDIGQSWTDLFQKNNILVIHKDFNEFVFDKEYGWSLAFYKLCALKYVLSLPYDNYVMIDTDTYTQRHFEDIWTECEHNILISEINKGLYNDDYSVFCEEVQAFLKSDEFITRYGGEFIAGNKSNLEKFISKCNEIYEEMKSEKFVTINGDEFISSIAAWSMRNMVKTGNAYIFRYWTAYSWYFVCSNYKHNPVCILHCPREKNHGFLKLFDFCKKNNKLPSSKYVYRVLNLDLFSYVVHEVAGRFVKYFKK